MACTIIAPCKINLHLAIGERRADGFHDIESLFAPLDLHDTLRLEAGWGEGEYSLEMNWEPCLAAVEGAGRQADGITPVIPSVLPEVIPMEKNLVTKAVVLFREKTGFKDGLHIRLDKRIPLGAGLGGGSSDAASTLLALNTLAGKPLSMEGLKEMALVLGSDVPFFLCIADDIVCPHAGGAAYVTGRGERIMPVKTPQGLWVLLVKPAFSSDTARAYRLIDQMRGKKKAFTRRERPPAEALVSALEGEPETWPFYNDFLPAFLSHSQGKRVVDPDAAAKAERYRGILAALKGAGASYSGLSGSGSCCFGVFKQKETAIKAEKMPGIPGNFIKLTFFLAQKTIPVLELQ